MKRFLKNFLLFFIPIIVMGFLTEWALRSIPNDYGFKNNYLEENASEIQTLILGSSHTYYGIDPKYLDDNAFNAAYVAQYLYVDEEIFNKFKSQWKQLNTLIISFGYTSLYHDTGENSRNRDYVLYYGFPANSFLDHFEIGGINQKYNALKLYRYFVLGKSDIQCSSLGWGLKYRHENGLNLERTGKTHAARHTNINAENSSELFHENMEIVKHFVRYCQQNNVRLIFLTTPKYKTYIKHLNTVQLNTTIEAIQKIADKYSTCYYLDYSTDSRFTKTDFYDADHLNDLGAKKLSKIMKDKIKTLRQK